MQEIISCPSCQRKLQVPESLLGQDVQCPTCGATFVASAGGQTAPAGTSAPPAPAPREPAPERRPPKRAAADYEEDVETDRPRRRRRDLLPHRGGMILAFGIISLVACAFFGPFAWVMGNNDLAEIRAGRMDPEGEGLTQAGRICGIIGTIMLIVSFLFGCVYINLMIAVIGAASGRQ